MPANARWRQLYRYGSQDLNQRPPGFAPAGIAESLPESVEGRLSLRDFFLILLGASFQQQ